MRTTGTMTWPAFALADDPAGSAGGVPLVLAVEAGMVQLRRAPPGTEAHRIAAWTTHPADGGDALSAVAGGRLFGVPLYRDTDAPYAPHGHAVWYRPGTASLSLEKGDDGMIAGLVAGYRWTLPPQGDGAREFRIEAPGGRIDLINGGGGLPPRPGQDRMVVNTGTEDLAVRAGNSSEDEELETLRPGYSERWTFEGRGEDGGYKWRKSGDGPVAAEVLVVTDVLRDRGDGTIAAGIDPSENGAGTAAPVAPAPDSELTNVNLLGAELARTCSLQPSRKTYRWTVLSKERGLSRIGRRLFLAEFAAPLELVLWRGGPKTRKDFCAHSLKPGETGTVQLHADNMPVDIEVSSAGDKGWQIACVADTADLPGDFHLSVHEPAA